MTNPDPLQLDSTLSQTSQFQVRGSSERRRNPISGVSTTSDPTRRFKPKAQVVGDKLHTPSSSCDFCSGRTIPPVLSSDGESVAIPDVTAAIERGRLWVERNGRVTRGTFSNLLDVFREDWRVSTAAARTFPNVCPLPGVGNIDVIEGFVTAAHPDYHDVDLCVCPPRVLCAVVDTWKAFHVWCESKGFILVPYINGGLDRRSGQSFAHPHSQHLVLGRKPTLYKAMQEAKSRSKCPICELRDMRDLHIAVPGSSKLQLMAHPAPEQSWSLVILSANCDDGFPGVDSLEFSTVFSTALRALTVVLGSIPPYNLVVRVGTGHFHAEIVPRNTNIKAGAEIALLEFFVDVAPSEVQAMLTAAISEGVSV